MQQANHGGGSVFRMDGRTVALGAVAVFGSIIFVVTALPFLTFQADCPYLVGSYAEIGAKLRSFAEKGVGTIILDMVSDETELRHVRKALHGSGLF